MTRKFFEREFRKSEKVSRGGAAGGLAESQAQGTASVRAKASLVNR